MAILAGIDEAGFGPTLGPLVVSGAVFSVPETGIDRSLWETLRASCTHRVSQRDKRLPIADSKMLHRPRSQGGSLSLLERTALVMLAAAENRPKNWQDLLSQVAPHAAAAYADYPWYLEANPALPLSAGVGDIGTRANAVRHDCAQYGVQFRGVFAEPLPEGHYNDLVLRTKNKAIVLLSLVMRIVDCIFRGCDEQRVRIHVDRLGGRTQYREPLMTSFPHFELEVVQASPTRSAYRLRNAGRVLEIDFSTEGEKRHLPTALASIFSKYLREVSMSMFNDYWARHLHDLKPTAGYYTDAKRWLTEAKPMLDRLGIDRGRLVRVR